MAARTALACAPPKEYALRLNDTSIVAPERKPSISKNFFANPLSPSKLPRKFRTHSTNSSHELESHIPTSSSASRESSFSLVAAHAGDSPHIDDASPHALSDGFARTSDCHFLTKSRYEPMKLLTSSPFIASENASVNARRADASVRRRIENEVRASSCPAR